jgi:Putative peptidoglycan binding domain
MDLPRHAISIAVLALLPAWTIIAEIPKAKMTEKKKSAVAKHPAAPIVKKTDSTRSGQVPGTRKTTSLTAARRTTTTASARQRGVPGKGRPIATPTRPPYQRQMQPTPERYKEIQQALVSRGYLRTDPSGTWDQETMDAMRRFQEDQNIDPTGKIDSLSLIALGLGPKHEIARAPAAAEPKPEAARPAAN